MKPLDGTRILIVDDEPFMRRTIRQMLKTLGSCDIHEAGDGAAALEEVVHCRPDVILCDIGMSPMSGLDFVEKLRAHADAQAQQTPVIMLTARKEEGTVIDALRAGSDDYLLKPVSSVQLAKRLSIALKR